MANVKKNIIQLNKITKEDKEIIGRRFLPLIDEYFKRPRVEADFKIWLAKRNKKVV